MKKTTLKRFMTLLLVLLWFVPSAVQAQTAEGSILSALEPITSENVDRMEMLGHYAEGGLQNEIAVSADGKWLATAATGGVVLYDATNGERVDFYPSPNRVWSLDFSPDSSSLAYSYYIAGDVIWDGAGLPGVGELPLSYSELTVRSIPDGKIRYQIPLNEIDCGKFTARDVQYNADGSRLAFHEHFGLKGMERRNFLCVLDSADGSLIGKHVIENLRRYRFSNTDPDSVWTMTIDYPESTETDRNTLMELARLNLSSEISEPLCSVSDVGFYGSFLALSTDDQWIVFGGDRVTVLLTRDGSVLMTQHAAEEDSYPFDSAAFSPDNSMLALGGLRGEQTFINTADWQTTDSTIFTFDNQNNGEWPLQALDMAFSPDGQMVYTLYNSSFVDIPEFIQATRLADKTELFRLSGRNTLDRYPALSPDGSLLTLGGYEDGSVQLWSVADQTLTQMLKGHQKSVNTTAFSADGAELASGSKDGAIRLWDVASGGEKAVLPGHAGGVWIIAYTNDGTRLLSVGRDGFLRVWNLADGSEVGAFDIGTADWEVNLMLPDADGKSVLVASGCQYPLTCMAGGSGDLRQVDLSSGEIRTPFIAESVYNLSISADGTAFAMTRGYSGVQSGIIRNGDTFIPAQFYHSPYGNGALMGAAISSDGSVVFSGNGAGLQAFDPISAQMLTLIQPPQKHSGRYGDLRMTADGKVLILSGGGGVSLWGVRTE